MAPEVILAMDEGQYEGKVDVWSLGITCIELAERKPPYFNMNAMSALYHIAQNESPGLADPAWSDVFRHFVDACLQKNPAERPTSERLTQHQFVARVPARTVLLDLIARTKNAVRDLDNLNYRKMKKILMNEMIETESNLGTERDDDDVSSIQDGEGGEGSSKSNSITSEHSLQSQGTGITSSAGSSTNSLPVAGGAEGGLDHHGHSPLQYALHNSHNTNRGKHASSHSSSQTSSRKPQLAPVSPNFNPDEATIDPKNFATIRTTSIVQRQQKEHLQVEKKTYVVASRNIFLRKWQFNSHVQLVRRRCTSRCPATRGCAATTRLPWLSSRRPAGDLRSCRSVILAFINILSDIL